MLSYKLNDNKVWQKKKQNIPLIDKSYKITLLTTYLILNKGNNKRSKKNSVLKKLDL